jgi:peptide/nickel transport system substrate-binding protein
VITCQTLPPTVPGYRPYCPYTLRRDESEQWHAPDLAAAQRLVRASGTAGAHVVLIAPGPQRQSFEVLAEALRSIGYDVDLRFIDGPTYFPVMARAAAAGQIQGGFTGWLADYPTASNFVLNQFTCRSIEIAANPAGFCNRALDKQIASAERLQVDDPEAAIAGWSEIDRAVVDQAPYVPLVTPEQVDIVSTRLQHFQRHPILGPLYAAAWVR